MASTNTMLKQCAGLVDTKDVTDWRVELDGHVYDPDESEALLHAVDRVRGIAERE